MGRRQTGSLLKKAVLPHTRNLHEAERSPPTSRYPMCGGSAAFGTGASPNPARSTPGDSRESYRPGPTSWRLVHPQLRRQPHAQTLRSSGPCPGTEMVQAEKEVWRFLFPPKCSGCRHRGCATNEPVALMSEVGHVRDNSWSRPTAIASRRRAMLRESAALGTGSVQPAPPDARSRPMRRAVSLHSMSTYLGSAKVAKIKGAP